MADGSNGPTTLESDLLETRKRLEVLDKNYRNLKGLSQKGERFIILRIISETKLVRRIKFTQLKSFRVVAQTLISVSAVTEFDELQKKCQDYYQKVSLLLSECSFLRGQTPAGS